MSYPYHYLDVMLGTKTYRLFRLQSALFLQRLTKENENSSLLPHIEDQTKKDVVIYFSEIASLLLNGDVHYDEEGRRTEYFFGELIVETNEKTRKLEVISEITRDDLCNFFAETPIAVGKITLSQKTKNKKQTSSAQRAVNVRVQTFLKIYRILLFVYCFIAILGRNDIFLYISAVLFLGNIVLAALFPKSFSIRSVHKGEKREEYFLGGFLLLPLLPSVFLLWQKHLNAENWVLPSVVIAVIVAGVMIFFFREEFKNEAFSAISICIVSFLIAVSLVSTLTFPNFRENLVSSEPAEIVSLDTSRSGRRGRTRNYTVTVKFADADTETYHITSSAYERMEKGDIVYIETYESFLGVTFTYVSE